MKGVPVWLLPNLLSLDAPLVAVAWQGLLAKTTGTPLRVEARVILFLTVWLIYVVDRLFDARGAAPAQETARHGFYRRHRQFATVLAAAIFVVDALLIVFALHPAVLRVGSVTFAGVCVYLVLLHGTTVSFPKEMVVALLFTAGTFLVAWTRSAGTGGPLVPAAIGFFLMCLANLVAIEHGESPSGVALGRWYWVWVPLLVVVYPWAVPGAWSWAIAAAAAGLGVIHALGNRLGLETRRVLIDTVLLVPAALLLL